jgi:L-threonylcarbamoyladenylate synthase
MSSYKTRVLSLHDPAAQEEALALLAQEEIFVAPTDTVYGVFARPDSSTAIERIYIAKARPPQKAIPVLIGELADLGQVARAPWSPLAEGLMAKFWPGALTLVLPAQPHLPAILTAEQPTVAVRMPAHDSLCRFLHRTGPLAATSANRSGGPDTHSAEEVWAQLQGCVPLILSEEAPQAQLSLSSTVVDLTDPAGPRILRQGQLYEAVSAHLAAVAEERGRR